MKPDVFHPGDISLVQGGTRPCRDNIFPLNTLSLNEKRPSGLIFPKMYSNCKICSVCLTFFP